MLEKFHNWKLENIQKKEMDALFSLIQAGP